VKRRLRAWSRLGLVVPLVAALLLGAGGAVSAVTAGMLTGSGSLAAGPILPVTSCASLARMNFTGVPDAPGKVTSATVVTDPPPAPKVPFCDVKGVFAPQTHFEMKLPVATWRGQYVQEGCGAFCGTLQQLSSDIPVAGITCTAAGNGELVLATDDEGHASSSQTDGRWAKNSLALRVVFGLTSEHSLAQMARAVMTAYYGRPASFGYYDGCSTGGREALMLAQRYPGDFNGIIAGAPASNVAPLALLNAWLVTRNTGPGGHQILAAGKIPALHAAVIAACGNAHGIITDPRHCGFNPASLQCPPGQDTDSCLTPAQVRAVREFYRGPADKRGRSLYNGGLAYGSELGWIGNFVEPASDTAAPADSTDAAFALNYFNDMAFWPSPQDRITLADVTFTDTEFRKLNLLAGAIYNANDPDLHAFAARGGKLILYHGWADQSIPPWSTLDYYAAVERASGGFHASQAFSRLYLIPGAYHCLYAPDGSSINLADFLTPLIAWVQHGTPPGSIPANTLSLTTDTITLTQNVRPYDALAPVTPAPGSLNAHYHYIGTYR
jgi:pimeloyl-ACP methyl ester carboxylesterase